jgi:hypothetical protein
MALPGENAMLISLPTFTVNVELLVTPLYEPEIVSAVVAETGAVVIGNVTVVAPAGTTTLVGTVVLGSEALSEIVAPPEGAMLEIVTVPVEEAPPTT